MDAEPLSDYEKKHKEQMAAMQKRIQSLPSNPVTESAKKSMKVQMGENDVWKQFEIVDKLVSSARKQVTDGETFGKTMGHLADAIRGLVDKGGKKHDTEHAE